MRRILAVLSVIMLCDTARAVDSCPSGWIEIDEPAVEIVTDDVCPAGYIDLGEVDACDGATSGWCYLFQKLAELCGAGVTKLVVGTGVSYNLYAEKSTSPSLVVRVQSGQQCYANLASGTESGALHVSFNGVTYHATN